MEYKYILVERDDGVGTITLNRPEVLNAINQELRRELDAAVTEFEGDSEIGAIIFTGSGKRAFSAGADIHEMAELAKDADLPPSDPDAALFGWHIAACTKPTIGAINGLAYGGGAVMASSFDIRVGCENTTFRFLAASYGRVNSTWSLPMQVGWPVAKELLFTARIVDAREAYRIGLLNHLVSCEYLKDKAIELAKQITANDLRMVQGVKELIIQDVGAEWEQMYRNEQDAIAGKLRPTPIAEGFKEFLGKKAARKTKERAPTKTGRKVARKAK